MKIVNIIPSFNVGGGELLAVRLCAEILRQHPSFDVYLVSLYDPIPTVVYDEAIRSGVTIITLKKRLGFDFFLFLRILNLFHKVKPDVIHTHLAGFRYSIFPALFSKCSVKIHTVHNIADRECSGVVRILQKIAFHFLGWMPVSLSEQIQASVQDVYDVNTPIVMNGIRTSDFSGINDKKEFKKTLHIPVDTPVIISIGRLCDQKNQILLLNAFLDLFKKIECTLLLVGEDAMGGHYRERLNDIIMKFPEHVRDKIFFLGPRKDISDLLSISNVFVLSSDWEGVPLTLLEAMSAKVPVVCTSVGGIPDVIEHKKEGLLVPKSDKCKLADAILMILHNQAFASSIAEKAFSKVQSNYSIECTAIDYLKLYRIDL